jgi:hypothetical protein
VLNFTSSLTRALPPHRGAALTAHKTSMDHNASAPVAQWHARARKAVVCPQAAQTPCTRRSLTTCWAPSRSFTRISRFRCANPAPQCPQSAGRRH